MDATISRRGLFRLTAGAGAAAALAGTAKAQDDPYDGWFDDVDNFEGTVDYSGEDTVEVSVGAGDNGLLFDPPAIQIDPGTTVIWEWTGEGGGHNVAEEAGVFESDVVSEGGHTYEQTFGEDDEGEIYRYVCTPHEAVGMFGAVAVGDVIEETIPPAGEETEDGGGPPSLGTGSLSDEGILATIGGVLLLALLSPVLFALLLKFVYEDDRPETGPRPPTQ